MAATFLSRLLLFTGTTAQLVHDWSGQDFLDAFEMQSGRDPNGGEAYYLGKWSGGDKLATVNSDGQVLLKVDTGTAGSNGRGTVKLRSNDAFNEGLFIMDMDHMPQGCGVWPADWPNNGEIDMVEYVNMMDTNQMTLHTSSGCEQSKGADMTGNLLMENCYAYATKNNDGCGIKTSKDTTCGVGFNNAGGGVIATQWSRNEFAKQWIFNKGSVPTDITTGQPDPSTWGTPMANFDLSGSCNGHFNNMHIIINIELCGGWAGGVWGSPYWGSKNSCGHITGSSSCDSFVRDNGDKMADAYFLINSLKIYQPNGCTGCKASPSPPQPSPSPGKPNDVAPKPSPSPPPAPVTASPTYSAKWHTFNFGKSSGLTNNPALNVASKVLGTDTTGEQIDKEIEDPASNPSSGTSALSSWNVRGVPEIDEDTEARQKHLQRILDLLEKGEPLH